MSIEATGGYSPDKVYGNLTYPFTPKNISIKAHTPLDSEDTETKAVSYNDFRKNSKVKSKLYNHKDDDYTVGIKTPSVGTTLSDFKNEEVDLSSSVSGFSASAYSAKDIVGGAIKRGYSAQQAVIVYRAQKAYETSAGVTKDPIKALSMRSYSVS